MSEYWLPGFKLARPKHPGNRTIALFIVTLLSSGMAPQILLESGLINPIFGAGTHRGTHLSARNFGVKIVIGNNDDNGRFDDVGNEDALSDAEQQGESEAQPVSDDPVAALESALVEAEQSAAESKDAMLRMHAEMENLRKRLIREHEKSRRLTLERFMNDLLPVRDSLERGLEAADQAADQAVAVKALKEGKQLIMKMLTKVMGDHGLETIDPKGEKFDPQIHEAMTMVPSDEHEENTVLNVLEKGYQLHDRLIRPAKVVVTRKP